MSEMEIVLALNELDMYPATKELTEDEIKRKWKLLIRYYHPDTNDTLAFQDGEKAKKVNHAKDFLIENLTVVNEYIRKVNNIKSEEDILKERQAEEYKRQQEEAFKKQAEEAYRKRQAEEAYKKQQQEQAARTSYSYNQQSSYNRQSNNTYSSYGSSNTNSSFYNKSTASNTSYTYKEEVKKESKFNFLFKFSQLLIAVVCIILTIASKKGFEIETGGTPLFAYVMVFSMPIIVLTAIPKARRQMFTYFVNSFFLFAVIIMTLACFE